jgi:hypothetical protein
LLTGDTGDSTEGQNGFWSLSNLAAGKSEQAAAHLAERHRLHWDSLVKLPHLEGSL